MLGRPAIVGHVTTRKPVPADRVNGRVDLVRRDDVPGSPWFVCEGTVEGEHLRREIQNGKEPSCGYTALAFGPGGTWHNIPYVREITKIEFHHLGVVQNARYEEGDIRLNAKTNNEGNTAMSLIKWIKKVTRPKNGGGDETVTEAAGELSPDAVIEVDGKQVKLNSLVESHRQVTAAPAAAAATATPDELDGETEIEVDGKTVKLNALVESHRKAEKVAADAKLEAEKLNARKTGAASFRVLQEAASKPPAYKVRTAETPGTADEAFKRGSERYGSASRN